MPSDRELDSIANALKAQRSKFLKEREISMAKMMDSSKPRRVPQPPLERRSKRDWDILNAMRNK